MAGITIPPPGVFGTEGNDQEVYQAGPSQITPDLDVIAVDVLAGATVDLLAGDDSFAGLAFTFALADINATAIGIRNSGDFLGNSGNDLLLGTSLIISSSSDNIGPPNLGGFSVGISNSGSEASISGGEGNDRMEGIGQGGIAALGIQNTGVINGDGGSDAITGTAFGGATNVGIANYGEISGGIGIDTMSGQATSILSLNKGFVNTGILNQGGKISGGDDNDVLIGDASGGIVGTDVIGISNQFDSGTLKFSVIDMGGGRDTLTGTASGGEEGANVVGIENSGGNKIDMGTGNDQVMATGGDRFSAYAGGGLIDLGAGDDTISGFGWQSVDGGTESDRAILGINFTEASFSTTGIGSDNIDITAGGVTMFFTNVESFEFLDGRVSDLSDLQAQALA